MKIKARWDETFEPDYSIANKDEADSLFVSIVEIPEDLFKKYLAAQKRYNKLQKELDKLTRSQDKWQ